MPIYEYRCGECDLEFEQLIIRDATPGCPGCKTDKGLERLISTPRVHSEGRKARSMDAARKRDQKQGSERIRAQREYELAHDD